RARGQKCDREQGENRGSCEAVPHAGAGLTAGRPTSHDGLLVTAAASLLLHRPYAAPGRGVPGGRNVLGPPSDERRPSAPLSGIRTTTQPVPSNSTSTLTGVRPAWM